MPGPTHVLYPIRHSVASDQTTARSVARRGGFPSSVSAPILPARPPFAVAAERARAPLLCMALGWAVVIPIIWWLA